MERLRRWLRWMSHRPKIESFWDDDGSFSYQDWNHALWQWRLMRPRRKVR